MDALTDVWLVLAADDAATAEIRLGGRGDAWPCAEWMGRVLTADELQRVRVRLAGRTITGSQLVECWRFIFDGGR